MKLSHVVLASVNHSTFQLNTVNPLSEKFYFAASSASISPWFVSVPVSSVPGTEPGASPIPEPQTDPEDTPGAGPIADPNVDPAEVPGADPGVGKDICGGP